MKYILTTSASGAQIKTESLKSSNLGSEWTNDGEDGLVALGDDVGLRHDEQVLRPLIGMKLTKKLFHMIVRLEDTDLGTTWNEILVKNPLDLS